MLLINDKVTLQDLNPDLADADRFLEIIDKMPQIRGRLVHTLKNNHLYDCSKTRSRGSGTARQCFADTCWVSSRLKALSLTGQGAREAAATENRPSVLCCCCSPDLSHTLYIHLAHIPLGMMSLERCATVCQSYATSLLNARVK